MFQRKRKLRQAYQAVFLSETGKQVLIDLFTFCRLYESTFVPDDVDGRESALREGRREVALRIFSYMKMTEEDIDNLVNQAKHMEDY